MSFCPECGKAIEKFEKFCSNCGKNLKEFFEDAEEKVEKLVKKTSYKGFFIFIIFLFIFGYVILDVWAIQQIRPDISLDNLASITENFQGNVGYGSTSISTRIILNNPTFVPVIMFPIEFKAGYDNINIITGKTDFIFIPSNSNKNVFAEADISYAKAGSSFLQGLANILTGQNKEFYIDFYELGIKFASLRK